MSDPHDDRIARALAQFDGLDFDNPRTPNIFNAEEYANWQQAVRSGYRQEARRFRAALAAALASEEAS